MNRSPSFRTMMQRTESAWCPKDDSMLVADPEGSGHFYDVLPDHER